MKRVLGLVLAGVLSGCVPAPLRAQSGAQLRLSVGPGSPPVTTVTGERNLYRAPGPIGLHVQTDRAAFVTSVVVAGGQTRVLPTVQTQPGVRTTTSLPATSSFTQVFTVASLEPMDLGAAGGARSVDEVAQVVQRAASGLSSGAYTVGTTVYRVEPFGALSVTASVPGAQVRVGGAPVGKAPVRALELPQGTVQVEVTREGYRPFTQRVGITPDALTEVSATLRPITGTLRLRTDVPADLLVEREFISDARPGEDLDVPLRPGVLSISVVPRDRTLTPQYLLVRVTADRVTAVVCRVTATGYACTLP